MPSLVVFGGAPYDAPLWTNRQHVTLRLAARGWRVLYVEPRLLLFRRLTDPSFLARLARPRRAAENIWVLAQANVLPFSRRMRWISAVNHRLVNVWRIRRAARRLGLHAPALLLYDTEAAEYLRDFPRSRVVYDCVDDHRVQAGVSRAAARVAAEERVIAERADALAVTTPPLARRFPDARGKVLLAPNAADVEAFQRAAPEPPDLARIPRPRIGTVGTLDSYKLDVLLLRTIVRARPEWQFVFVGPVTSLTRAEAEGEGGGEDLAELYAFPNVHFLGLKPRAAVPGYVQWFDAAIIPYRTSPYNRASFPLKFWEFCAAGVPVVASGLPSLAPYAHLATLADGPDAFGEGIALALREGEMARAARQAEARRHGYAARVDVLEKLLTG